MQPFSQDPVTSQFLRLQRAMELLSPMVVVPDLRLPFCFGWHDMVESRAGRISCWAFSVFSISIDFSNKKVDSPQIFGEGK